MNKEITKLITVVKKHKYRNLIFDLDCTLTKLDVPWPEWNKRITRALPPDIAKKLTDMLAIEGSPWGQVVNDYLVTNKSFYDEYIAICREFESDHFSHTPYNELMHILPQLKEMGAKLYVWTSNTRPTAERALQDACVLHLFSQLLTREDVTLGKPHAEGWQHFPFADDPKTCLMIGDSQNDEFVAKEVGMDYFQVRYFSKPQS